MSETEKIMVTVPLSDYADGIMAKEKLDSVRELLLSGKEYCSDAVKIVLGIYQEE